MSKWEEMANNCPEYIIEAQIDRDREEKFKQQIVDLWNEGMDVGIIAAKLDIDKEWVEEIIKEQRKQE